MIFGSIQEYEAYKQCFLDIRNKVESIAKDFEDYAEKLEGIEDEIEDQWRMDREDIECLEKGGNKIGAAPCPFCGDCDSMHFCSWPNKNINVQVFVACESCGTQGPYSTTSKQAYEKDKDDIKKAQIKAVKYWNERSTWKKEKRSNWKKKSHG